MKSNIRDLIPFLHLLPESLYFLLDSSEWCIPDAFISQLRTELETLLGHYVMTYKRDVFNDSISFSRHLCANIKGAELSPSQLFILKQYESLVQKKNVSFVVYQKPLTFTNPLWFQEG